MLKMAFELMPFVQGKIPLAYPSTDHVLSFARSNHFADEKSEALSIRNTCVAR